MMNKAKGRVYTVSILQDNGGYNLYKIYESEEAINREFPNQDYKIKMPSGRERNLYKIEEQYLWG